MASHAVKIFRELSSDTDSQVVHLLQMLVVVAETAFDSRLGFKLVWKFAFSSQRIRRSYEKCFLNWFLVFFCVDTWYQSQLRKLLNGFLALTRSGNGRIKFVKVFINFFNLATCPHLLEIGVIASLTSQCGVISNQPLLQKSITDPLNAFISSQLSWKIVEVDIHRSSLLQQYLTVRIQTYFSSFRLSSIRNHVRLLL